MYRTCLFCHADLGANETLELLPVGRRLAFDGSMGRLWVVCRLCGRWNLTPLESRWEAIEQAERAFERARPRAATENIALARAEDGSDLVRIGSAERMELATWRYGGQLRRRRVVQYAYAGVFGAFALATIGGAPLVAALPGGALAMHLPQWFYTYRLHFGILARVETDQKKRAVIRGHHARAARLENYGEGPRLIVKHDQGRSTLEGEAATEVTSRLLVGLNLDGASSRGIRDAVKYLETAAATGPIAHISKTLPGTLTSLPRHVRYALEIATQEETERKALTEELVRLEDAWREAEEIASIADNLLVPEWVTRRLERLRPSPNQTVRDGD